jgi:hypothetical protein
MSLPATTRQYSYPEVQSNFSSIRVAVDPDVSQLGSFDNLIIQEVPVSAQRRMRG